MHDDAQREPIPLCAVILAAGFGRRLGADRPKPIVEIAPGVTLLGNLVDALGNLIGRDRVTLVLGHGAELIRAEFPDRPSVINPGYETTNTAKSLLVGLNELMRGAQAHGSENRATPEHSSESRAAPTPVARASRPCENVSESGAISEAGDVLWVNADLYVDHATARRFIAASALGTRSLVNRASVGDEEVKYALDDAGAICSIGKRVDSALGEALGMNIVSGRDLPAFMAALHAADDQDYFEAAMNRCVQSGNMRIAPIDAGAVFCREVDTPADLEAVREHLGAQRRTKGGEQ